MTSWPFCVYESLFCKTMPDAILYSINYCAFVP